MPEYPTLLHRWFDEVWNQQREEAIDEMMTEDVVIHGLGTITFNVRGLVPVNRFAPVIPDPLVFVPFDLGQLVALCVYPKLLVLLAVLKTDCVCLRVFAFRR